MLRRTLIIRNCVRLILTARSALWTVAYAIAIMAPAYAISSDIAAQRQLRVAVCQILVIESDREGNFRRIEYALSDAAEKRVDLAVFPESSILGWENPEAHALAEPIPGRDSDRISELARKYGMMIAIGLDEKEGDKLYDSAILVDKTGRILWKHRKINVLPGLMSPPYTPGLSTDIHVVTTELGRVGMLICADTFTDSHIDKLRDERPDLVIVPLRMGCAKGCMA